MAEPSQGHHRRRSLAYVRNSTSAIAPAIASSPVRRDSGTHTRRQSQHVHHKCRERSHSARVGATHANRDDHDSDAGANSDFSSSRSTSDDVEMKDMLSDDGLDDDEETGLTRGDRRRRRRRKRQNGRLDARVVKEPKTTKAIKLNSADQSVLRRSVVNVSLIGCWYVSSQSLSIIALHPQFSPTIIEGISLI